MSRDLEGRDTIIRNGRSYQNVRLCSIGCMLYLWTMNRTMLTLCTVPPLSRYLLLYSWQTPETDFQRTLGNLRTTVITLKNKGYWIYNGCEGKE
jgi:hypothetical protein